MVVFSGGDSYLPVFVVAREAVDDDWHRKRHDEDAAESTEATHELAQEGMRVQVVADCRDRHQAPPGLKFKSMGLNIAIEFIAWQLWVETNTSTVFGEGRFHELWSLNQV